MVVVMEVGHSTDGIVSVAADGANCFPIPRAPLLPSTIIEEIQDCVDKLVLNIFEVARGHSDLSSGPQRSENLIAVYRESVNSIDRLVGIDKTKVQQELYLAELSTEYEGLKKDVLELEAQLKKVVERTDIELDSLLDYKSH